MATISATHTVVKSRESNRPFGQGLLASHPYCGRLPFNSADAVEVAQMSFDHEDGSQDVAGELLNTLVPAIEAMGAEIEDRSVSATGFTVNVCGKRVRIEFI